MPSVFDPHGSAHPTPRGGGGDTRFPIEDRLRRMEAEKSRQESVYAQRLHHEQDRAAVANRLLHELALQTLGVINKRNYPRALEILSVNYGVPGTRMIEPIRVATGNVVALTLRGFRWGEAGDIWGPSITKKAYAISDAGQLLYFQRAWYHFHTGSNPHSGSIRVSGSNLWHKDKHRAQQAIAKRIRAAAQRAGCDAAVASLTPVSAYGQPYRHPYSDAQYDAAFYLDESGKLVYGNPGNSIDAEEEITSALL